MSVSIKCLLLIVGFAVTVAIWPREVVSCCDFLLHAVATFWAMSPVGIYPGRASNLRNSDGKGRNKINSDDKTQLFQGGLFLEDTHLSYLQISLPIKI